jgi:hypothetical protein
MAFPTPYTWTQKDVIVREVWRESRTVKLAGGFYTVFIRLMDDGKLKATQAGGLNGKMPNYLLRLFYERAGGILRETAKLELK